VDYQSIQIKYYLMADGALNTVFTQEEFDKIKAKARRN
jgi:hypothetical protein